GPCGIPWTLWNDNGANLKCIDDPTVAVSACKGVKDYFYRYGPLYGDNKCSNGTQWDGGNNLCDDKSGVGVGYFGYKVLGVSYGGTLQLFGYKGTPLLATSNDGCTEGAFNDATKKPQDLAEPTSTGCSWLRLA